MTGVVEELAQASSPAGFGDILPQSWEASPGETPG
jgi:hypothetical protein